MIPKNNFSLFPKNKYISFFFTFSYIFQTFTYTIANNNIGKACYHYAIRLADLKEYQNKLLWIVSVCIYSVFSVFTLKCNYGASLMQCFTIQREIFRLLKKNDFSKYIFLQTLKLCK